MILIEKNTVYLSIEKEEEIFIAGLIIEPKDEIELKIVRNVFSYSNGTKKKIDRIETLAKIEVEKVKYVKETGFLRVKGKIMETEKDVTKGYHAENIKVGSRIKIFKKDVDKIKIFVERKELLKIENKIELKNLEFENLEELVEYGILNYLYICLDVFFEKKEIIRKCFEKRTKVIIVKDREFCEKIKLAGRRRF